MSKKFLFIVEGEKTEKNILIDILTMYGFKPINIKDKLNLKSFNFTNYCFTDDDETDCVYIVQGPKNRISELLNDYNSKSDDIDKFFFNVNQNFAGIFIIYDADHNEANQLNKFYEIFNDETDQGILLLSTPCIEVLGDEEQDEFRCLKFRDYKAKLNTYHHNKDKCNVEDYIKQRFNELLIHFIKKNTSEFNETNIMMHPQEIIKHHNKTNVIYSEKEGKQSTIRYYSTVIYVAIAYMLGLTREIDNSQVVLRHFENIII